MTYDRQTNTTAATASGRQRQALMALWAALDGPMPQAHLSDVLCDAGCDNGYGCDDLAAVLLPLLGGASHGSTEAGRG